MQEQQPIRVVVGEGRAQRQGLLSFVLEGEGMQVVATATTPAELARSLAEHRPDVVVLDDGIGSIAVSLTRQMLPGAKVVVVWPRGVVAIDGDASVEPSEVLRQLGATVGRVMGPAPPHVATFRRAGSGTPVGRGRARGRGPTDRDLAWNGRRHSTVTRITSRAQRSHPSMGMPTDGRSDEPVPASGGLGSMEGELAEVIVLPAPHPAGTPETASQEANGAEPLVVIPEAMGPDRKRRRGSLLVAAALVPLCLAASMLALAGIRHVQEGVVRAEEPVVASPSARGAGPSEPVRPSAITVDRRGRSDDHDSSPPTTGGAPASVAANSGTTAGTGGSNEAGGGTDPGAAETNPGQSGDRNPHGGPPGLLQSHRPVLGVR
jgi:hypothetical protein